MVPHQITTTCLAVFDFLKRYWGLAVVAVVLYLLVTSISDHISEARAAAKLDRDTASTVYRSVEVTGKYYTGEVQGSSGVGITSNGGVVFGGGSPGSPEKYVLELFWVSSGEVTMTEVSKSIFLKMREGKTYDLKLTIGGVTGKTLHTTYLVGTD